MPVNWRKQQTELKREGFQGNCRILERRWSLGRIGFASVIQDEVVLGTSRRVFINRISIGIYTYMYQWHVFEGDTGQDHGFRHDSVSFSPARACRMNQVCEACIHGYLHKSDFTFVI